MRIFKRSLAVVLAVATVLTLSACHPKDEVAVTVTDKKSGISTTLTTAQYIYAYTNAVLEANSNIDEHKKDADKEIKDYTKHKVTETDEDGKETKVAYEKWVDGRAEELMRNYAAAMIKQKALKFKIDDATQQSIDSYSQMYWQYYYQPVFEKNGVGFETYKKMFTSSYYENEYFLSIYDKDGTDEVPEKTVNKTFYDSYCLADAIAISVKTEDAEETEGEETTATEEQGEKLPALFTSFAKELDIQLPAGKALTFGQSLYWIPAQTPSLRGIKVLRPGLELGELKKDRFEPAHALALWLGSCRNTEDFSADSNAIADYLKGNVLTSGKKGWCLVTVDGYSIGWGKGDGRVLKNHYPKGLRRFG